MSIQHVDKSGWVTFFDVLNKTLAGKRAEIEVASLDLGDQVEAEWLIRKPREIYVDYDVADLIAIDILDSDGAHHIIKLRDPLALPSPAGSARQTAAQPT